MNEDWNTLLWHARPREIPGLIEKILQSEAGFIRPLIDLRYPNGEEVVSVYCANLTNFQPQDKVLFTTRASSPKHRQNPDKGKPQPDKVDADEVWIPENRTEIDDAIESFNDSYFQRAVKKFSDATEKADKRNKDAETAQSNAEKKEKEYLTELAGLPSKIEQQVTDLLASEREKLRKQQEDFSERERKVRETETQLSPYMRLIALPPLQVVQPTHTPLPTKLAERWTNRICANGFTFSENITKSFLLCITAAVFSGSIVLLNGSVGVGKTSLVKEVARVIGGDCNIFPVRPAWVDPSDLLGFFDPINNTFRPTPFTTALLRPQDNRLRLLCLDELNLARVENYAADLLSCMEYARTKNKGIKENSDAGELKLYSKDISTQLANEAKDIKEYEDKATNAEIRRLQAIQQVLQNYPAQFQFPATTVLIGTLNSDDTTYDLSPKMIDRSYVITLPPVNFALSHIHNPEDKHTGEQIAVTVSELVERIDEAINATSENWKIVLEWNDKLQHFGIPLGHRVKRDYDVFRAAGSVLGISEFECIGYFLFCKILPRIFFFKGQNNVSSETLEKECKTWLDSLKGEYSQFGPVSVIDAMIKMCDDGRVSVVRYWSK